MTVRHSLLDNRQPSMKSLVQHMRTGVNRERACRMFRQHCQSQSWSRVKLATGRLSRKCAYEKRWTRIAGPSALVSRITSDGRMRFAVKATFETMKFYDGSILLPSVRNFGKGLLVQCVESWAKSLPFRCKTLVHRRGEDRIVIAGETQLVTCDLSLFVTFCPNFQH
jgi:hypothetical protein